MSEHLCDDDWVDGLQDRIVELEDTLTHYASDDFGEWLEGVHELWTQAEVELAAQKALLSVVPDARGGKS